MSSVAISSSLKISIVTISFNQAQFLEECILSVLNQNYPNIEYIVVDPGSTDGSRDIIEKYRDRIKHVIYEKDDGPADGLNKGFAKATGDIYGFLNSDDTLLSGALSRIAEVFTGTDCDVVSGEGYLIDNNGRLIRNIMPTKFVPTLYLYGAVTIFQQGVFFLSDMFINSGGFNVENKICWDGELFLAMASIGAKFHYLHKPIATFRIYDDSITGGAMYRKKLRLENEKLFMRYYGRKPNILDQILGYFFRVYKLIVNPSYVFKRLFFSGNFGESYEDKK